MFVSHGYQSSISSITGLNPASIPFLTDLQSGDANLVDCIHTTNSLLTTNSATCDIDFYVNPVCSCSSGNIPVNSGMMFAVTLNSDIFRF